MAYQTGTSSGPADLLTKLNAFAALNGWTVTTATSGFVLSKGSIVCGIASNASEIQTRGALSVNAGVAWSAQPNNAGVTAVCNVGAGPFPAYHFYASDENGSECLAAVVEVVAGIYRHIVVCSLVKDGAGSYTGGTYIGNTYHDLNATRAHQIDSGFHHYLADSTTNTGHHVWCDADGRSNSWSIIRNASDQNEIYAVGNNRYNGLGYNLSAIGYTRYSLRSPITPLMIFQNRPLGFRSLLGRLPNIRRVNMALYPVGFQDNIGGDDWDMWPNTARVDSGGNNADGVPGSGWYGYAYRHIE